MPEPVSNIGVVVIGRNEGERLRTCLLSVLDKARAIVYVDSGSTDSSVGLARSLEVEVVELPVLPSFTAARARNAGFARLVSILPEIEAIQFVDGDCEVLPGWLATGMEFLKEHRDVAIVCGRRRERFPEASIFNALCDREWNTPVGESRACGGDALMRRTAFEEVGGFLPSLIAGEEPELCIRLRAAAWRIWRLDRDMTLHDAAILHWRQWWRRTLRSGHAFAQGAWLHGAFPERHWVTETRRALLWGVGIPTAAIVLASICLPVALLLLGLFPVQALRLAVRYGTFSRPAWSTGFLLVAGRIPEAAGAMRFWLGRLFGRGGDLIEYK